MSTTKSKENLAASAPIADPISAEPAATADASNTTTEETRATESAAPEPAVAKASSNSNLSTKAPSRKSLKSTSSQKKPKSINAGGSQAALAAAEAPAHSADVSNPTLATTKPASVRSNKASAAAAAAAEKEAKEKEAKEKEAKEKEKQARKEKARKEREQKEHDQRIAAIKEKEEREKVAKAKAAAKEKQAKAAAAAKKTPPVTIPADVSKIDPLEAVDAPSPETTPKPTLSAAAATTTEHNTNSPGATKPKDPFPYRHFTSLHPCANRLLAMKWDRDDRKKHLKKLAAVKPKVDNCAPKLYRHLQTKPKKHQMDQERQAEIHRNNRILLERMSNIMYMEAHDPEIHATRRFQVLTNAGPRARAREQIKIALENKKLFERLQGKQPDYNRHKLLDQHFKHLLHLQNISSFPQKYMDQRVEYEVILKKKKSMGGAGVGAIKAKTADGPRLPALVGGNGGGVVLPVRPKTSGDMIGAL